MTRIRRLFVAAALVVAVALAVSAPPADADCNTRECEKRVERKQCDRGMVDPCLRVAARRHGVPYGLLRGIAWCESRLRADARNPFSTAGGTMQFLSSTWAGLPPRFSSRSRYSAKWSTRAGAWLISRVGTAPWAASRHCWG